MSAINISLAPEAIAHVGSMPITNSLLMGSVTALILIIVALFAQRKISLLPTKLQNFWELMIEQALNFMDNITQDRKKSLQVFPIVFTIFIFVLLSNWLGLLPGAGSIGRMAQEGQRQIIIPFIRSASADLNFTLALALVAVISTQLFGIVAVGFWKFSKRYLNFHGPINFFVGILELISEVAKLVSFSFRLFGNVFAGEVLLTVVAFLVPYFVPLPFLFLEVFVGFIQALVFAMLTLVFVSLAETCETH